VNERIYPYNRVVLVYHGRIVVSREIIFKSNRRGGAPLPAGVLTKAGASPSKPC